jgi:hypothetical protein
VIVNRPSVNPPAEEVELSPHLNGPAVREARERLGLSPSDLIARAGGAFGAKWLAAAEDGARVNRRQLMKLAAILEVEPIDISVPDDGRPPIVAF